MLKHQDIANEEGTYYYFFLISCHVKSFAGRFSSPLRL